MAALVALAGVATSVAAACGRDASQPFGLDLTPSVAPSTSPTPTSSPLPTSTASPTPPPQYPWGTGVDGPLTLAAATATPVNVCRPLVAGSGSQLTLGSAMPLAAGDMVLTLQVQASQLPSGTAAAAVSAADAAGSGNWDLVNVASASGTAVTLSASLAHVYVSDATHTAQVCRVPQYTTVSLSNGAKLVAPAWDGSVGGVVAFFASTDLTISGSSAAVDASAAGFRGGRATNAGNGNADVTALETNADDGGGKGEGIVAASWATQAGRGQRANGAGGGNALSAGGGGGGNAGQGGIGGKETDRGTGSLTNGGYPGVVVALPLPDGAVLGGGGGGGQGGSTQASAGGAGGGLVLVRAHTVNNGRFIANGATGANGPDDNSNPGIGNGGGGGGAGGTILVFSTSGSASFSATGGKGGDAQDQSQNGGPGGGGGGGRIYSIGLTANGTPAIGAGNAGKSQKAGNAYGAANGQGGQASIN